jgi:hypothetical protein
LRQCFRARAPWSIRASPASLPASGRLHGRAHHLRRKIGREFGFVEAANVDFDLPLCRRTGTADGWTRLSFPSVRDVRDVSAEVRFFRTLVAIIDRQRSGQALCR